MFNLLRFIVIIVTALVVFGWSLVAADQVRTRSTPTNIPSVDDWVSMRNVRLEAMPDIPKRTRYAKPKLELTPTFSRPDFGDFVPVPVQRLEVRLQRPRTYRSGIDSAVAARDWHRGVLDSSGIAFANSSRQTASESASPPSRTPVPAVGLIVSDNSSSATPPAFEPPSAIATANVPTANVPTNSKPVALQPSGLNFRALRERIEAHNFSVAAIEERLRTQDDWDLLSIESMVSQIAEVQDGRALWELYWNILEPGKRRRIGLPLSLDNALDSLRQRIFETRVVADVDYQSVSHLEETKTQDRLRELDQRVAKWLEAASGL